MIKAGLTGGYASGKSFVAAEVERLGCRVLYADRLGHQVLEPGGAAYQPAVEAFGPSILAPGGVIDRKRLAAIVFSDPALLQILNSFVHPAVFELESRLLAEFAGAHPDGIAVIEAAILIETGRYKMLDRILLTACSEELQILRGMERDGLTRAQVEQRLRNQMSLESKKQYADYVIDTGAAPEQTISQVRAVVEDLRRLASGSPA